MGTFVNIGKRLAFLLLGTLILFSCVQEERVTPTEQGSETLTFYLHLPGATVVETRGVGSVEENKIANLWLLAFEGTTLKSKTEITDFEAHTTDLQYENGNVWKFKTDIATGYTLVALANAGDKIGGISVNMTKDAVVKSLYYTQVAGTKWSVDSSNPIPMWGELTGYTPAAAATCRFEMMRMLAKINVDASSISTGTFTLESIAIYNYNTKNYLVPQNVASNKVSAVTTWDDATNMGRQSGSLTYSGSTEISGNKCADKIYVFEAATKGKFPAANANWATETDWLTNPCLIIGGKFGGSSAATTYYRVDFIEKDTDGTNSGSTGTKDLWHSLLRNHSYNVAILSVDGAGYATAGNALSSAPMNMDVSTYVYDESDKQSITLDGPYYLSVEKLLMDHDAKAQTTTNEIKTNYPGGWTAQLSTSKTAITAPTLPWFTKAETASGLSLNVQENTTPSARTPLYLHIKAGRMSQVVTVTQSELVLYLTATLADGTAAGRTQLWYSKVFDIAIQSNTDWVVDQLIIAEEGGSSQTITSTSTLGTYFDTVSGTGNATVKMTVPLLDNNIIGKTFTVRFKTTTGAIYSQNIVITQYMGIPAFPNIIGVDNTGTLNLTGTGWTVYYKWGSLVAVAGSENTFSASQIVGSAGSYNLNTLKSTIGSKTDYSAWSLVPYVDWDTSSSNVFSNPSTTDGYGDPCRLFGSTYRMPTEPLLDGLKPTAGSFATNGKAKGLWYGSTQFYPAAGLRAVDGKLENVSASGNYWTTSANSQYSATRLLFTTVSSLMNSNGDREMGHPVRCLSETLTATFPNNSLTADAKSRTAVFPGSTQQINVKSNTDWQLSELIIDGTTIASSAWSSHISATSGTGNQTLTFNVPTMVNGHMKDRDIKFKFKTASGLIVTEQLVLTQRFPGVRAEKNIISIDNTGTLNLDGRGWIVYYKWGSVIALGAASVSDNFTSDYVFGAPSAYDTEALRASMTNDNSTNSGRQANWDLIPFDGQTTGQGVVSQYITSPNHAIGKGDPCTAVSSSFKMPTATVSGATFTVTWFETLGAWVSDNNGIGGRYNEKTGAGKQFYPAVGAWSSIGTLIVATTDAFYWTDKTSGSTNDFTQYMTFNSSSVRLNGQSGQPDAAFAVRCVAK